MKQVGLGPGRVIVCRHDALAIYLAAADSGSGSNELVSEDDEANC